jgi:hypothetical protein
MTWDRLLTRLAQHPALAIVLGMAAAGFLLTATSAFLGRGFVNAIAPAFGGLLFVSLAARYRQSKPKPPGSTRRKVVLIVLCCAFMLVIILIAVPAPH